MFEYSLQRHKSLPQETLDLLELHQLAQTFRLEQDYREAHKTFCRHYHNLVQQHREDHAVMQNELNVFAVFWKKRDHS